MDEFFNWLVNTPFRTVAIVIGLIVLSIGYGLNFRAYIDTEKLNKTYAKIVGAILIVIGIVGYLLDFNIKPGMSDPFLPYYIVSVVVIIALTSVALRFTNGQQQLTMFKYLYAVITVLITFVVIWRANAVYFYVSNTGGQTPPLGFKTTGGYVPYFILLSTGVAIIAWLIYANTKKTENSENRVMLFRYFSMACVYLGFCRIAWEVVDNIGIAKLVSP